jgi:hypothetical protein
MLTGKNAFYEKLMQFEVVSAIVAINKLNCPEP